MTIPQNSQSGQNPATTSVVTLWWVVALRAALAMALGIIVLLWPIVALLSFVWMFAAYCLLDAFLSITLAVRSARLHARWWWPALHAVLALVAAAIALLDPGITLILFVAMLIAWAALNGAVALAAAFQLDRAHGRWWLIASGIASLVLAALLIAWPPIGLFTLVWMFAFYVLTAGFSLAGAAVRLRAMRSTVGHDKRALPIAP